MGSMGHGLGSGGDFGINPQHQDPTSTPDGVGPEYEAPEEIDLEALRAQLDELMKEAEESVAENPPEPSNELENPWELQGEPEPPASEEDIQNFLGSLRPMRILLNGHDLCELYDRGIIVTSEIRAIIGRDYPEIDPESMLL